MQNHFHSLIPEFYSKLIDWNDPKDPLRKMVEPSSLENEFHKYEISDPIGDKPKTALPGLIHRYPDRMLLNLTSVCAVHCRFCFRKNLLNEPSLLSKEDLTKIFDYLKTHKEIWEVIFSGGDPFMIQNALLKEVLEKLAKIKHIKIIRFHTRIPVVDPNILARNKTIQLLKNALGKGQQLIIAIHINHPREITDEFQKTVRKFQKIGAILLSQTVLLKEVNDDAGVLTELFRRLVGAGVKPYYLHHLDIAKGTHYFRVSIERGKEIFQELQKNLSTICLPQYVIDFPKGIGKISVFWLKKNDAKIYTGVNFDGKRVTYEDFS